MFASAYSIVASGTAALYRKNDGTGWVPVDPINNAKYYYAYAATATGGKYFEFNAFIESQKYGFNGSKDVVSTDGGNNTSTLEMGNAIGLSL